MRFLFLALAALASPFAASNQPNIVLIMTDDQGYGDLGVHGNTTIDTPRLDQFASESLVMERFYVNPLCSPTRASLMTGRYHLRTGILHTSRGAAKMWGDEITIAEILRDSGYRTGIFGKWHLGDNYPMRPQDQGFDEVYIHKSGGIGQTPDTAANYFEPIVWRNGERLQEKGYCTDLFFDAALEFIAEEGEDPFFVYLAPNVPHGPLEVSQSYSEPFLKAGLSENVSKIYGMLKNLDENVGRLLDSIDRLGKRSETVVIFMTDNGPTKGRYNAGMRGAKASVYEGGIRVPFYVRWPRTLEAGKRIDRIAAHIDVLPTLVSLAEIPLPSNLLLDGTNLMPLWTGSVSVRAWPSRTLYTQHIKSIEQAPFQNATAFDGRYKMVSYPKTANEAEFAPDFESLELSLYDLEEDPSESRDISKSNPERLISLKRDYENWFESMKATRQFEPGRIELGTSHENPALLCRYQDGHRRFGTDAEPIGWPVKIGHAATYRIAIRSDDAVGSVLVISWQGREQRIRLAPAQRMADFELEAGEGMIDVWLENVDGSRLPRDFDVIAERL